MSWCKIKSHVIIGIFRTRLRKPYGIIKVSYVSNFLIVPSGTGDIQITLSQCITFTGAIIVTTPHELSLADATKGVAMFEDLRVPTLAVVSG